MLSVSGATPAVGEQHRRRGGARSPSRPGRIHRRRLAMSRALACGGRGSSRGGISCGLSWLGSLDHGLGLVSDEGCPAHVRDCPIPNIGGRGEGVHAQISFSLQPLRICCLVKAVAVTTALGIRLRDAHLKPVPSGLFVVIGHLLPAVGAHGRIKESGDFHIASVSTTVAAQNFGDRVGYSLVVVRLCCGLITIFAGRASRSRNYEAEAGLGYHRCVCHVSVSFVSLVTLVLHTITQRVNTLETSISVNLPTLACCRHCEGGD